MLNTYNIKMTGLKKASGDTKCLSGYYSGEYAELFFDHATGEVWTVYQYSLGQNSWTEFDKKDVVKVCNLSEPTTMQQIADLIKERLDYLDAEASWAAKASQA